MCCPPEEDRNYESFEFNTPGLIEIQNEGNLFSQGDTLWVKSVIPNTLPNEDGEQIDIQELREDSETAYLSLNLYLENSFSQPSPIVLSEDELFSTTGSITYKYNIEVTAVEIDNQIQTEFGIVLKEKGNYFLGSAYLQNPLSFYLNITNYNNIIIITSLANQDNDKFRFSVE